MSAIYLESDKGQREVWTVEGSFADALDFHQARGQAIIDSGQEPGANTITERDLGAAWTITFEKAPKP